MNGLDMTDRWIGLCKLTKRACGTILKAISSWCPKPGVVTKKFTRMPMATATVHPTTMMCFLHRGFTENVHGFLSCFLLYHIIWGHDCLPAWCKTDTFCSQLPLKISTGECGQRKPQLFSLWLGTNTFWHFRVIRNQIQCNSTSSEKKSIEINRNMSSKMFIMGTQKVLSHAVLRKLTTRW